MSPAVSPHLSQEGFGIEGFFLNSSVNKPPFYSLLLGMGMLTFK